MADGLSPDAWARFYREVLRHPDDDAFRLPVSENDEYKPGCNDAPSDTEAGDPTIVSRFWSYASVAELTPFVDPVNWKELSPYWQQMDVVEGPEDIAGGYRAVFLEVVDLPTGPVAVHLAVDHLVDDHFAMTTFSERGDASDDIVRDRGYVMVTDESHSPGRPQTLVYATKTIVFREPILNELTELACDNGWVDLLITMALPQERRPDLGPTIPVHRIGRGPGDDARSGPTELDRWATSAHRLVDRIVATSRVGLTGLRQGRVDGEVLDALLDLGDHVTRTARHGAGAWSEFVGDLAAPEDSS